MSDFYIAHSAIGAGDASSMSNAAALSYFNTAGNWNNPKIAGKIGPNDTVHLCGIISGALIVQNSGSIGSGITILFEPDSRLSAPTWGTTGAIVCNAKHCITIDGGASGLIGGPNGNTGFAVGIIECTDNGTLFNHQLDAYGIKAQNSHYFTVKNLYLRNLFVRVSGSTPGQFGKAISNTCTINSISNYQVTNCLIHDAFCGIDSDYGTGSQYEFSYNTVFNCNWGGRCGDRNAASLMTGLRVHHNLFYNWKNWNGTGGDIGLHHNGFYAWAENQGTMSGAYFYSNFIGPGYGNGDQTAGIFISNTNGTYRNVQIYNNIFIANSGEFGSNGFIVGGDHIYNNTMIGGYVGTAIGIGAEDHTYNVKNNLAVNFNTFISCNDSAESTLISDNNLGYNLSSGQAYSKSNTSSSQFKTFAQWTGLGYDLNSRTGNPLLNLNFQLSNDSPAINAGADLSNYFSTDYAGNQRPNGSAWDIGAYEYILASLRRLGRNPKLRGLSPN